MISWCSWKLFSVFAFGVIFTLLTVTLLKLFDQLNGSSSTAGSILSSSSPQHSNKDLENQVLKVSPLDVQNNSSPYLRQGPTLDSLMGYGDPSSALTSSLAHLNDISFSEQDLNSMNLETGLSDSNLQAVQQLLGAQSSFGAGGVVGSNSNDRLQAVQQLLGAQSSFGAGGVVGSNSNDRLQAVQQLLGAQSSFGAGGVVGSNSNDRLQAVQQLLGAQSSFGAGGVLGSNSNDRLQAVQQLLGAQSSFAAGSVVGSNSNDRLQAVQQLLGAQSSFGAGGVVGLNSNDQLLNLLQPLLAGQSVSSPSIDNAYSAYGSSPMQGGSDQVLNSLQSVLGSQMSSDVSLGNVDNLSSLMAGGGGQMVNTLVPQQYQSNPEDLSLLSSLSSLSSLQTNAQLPAEPKFNLPKLNLDDSLLTDLSNNPSLDSLQSILAQQPSNALSTLGSTFWPKLDTVGFPSPGSQVTQLVFDNQVPNLHVYACKLVFQFLVNKAYRDYLKLAAFPSCQNQNFLYPSTAVPFKIVVVQKVEKPSLNPTLLKFLWLLLQKQQRTRPPAVILPPPIILPPTPAPTPSVSLQNLLTLLNIINTPKYKPNNQYLNNLILNIIQKRYPDSLPFTLPHKPFLPGQPLVPPVVPSIDDKEYQSVTNIFIKYFPQRRFTPLEIQFLIKLIHLLPRTINELVINHRLLKAVINVLTVWNFNPKLTLAIIYSHLMHSHSTSSTRVVEVVYKVKKNPTIVQPYYYVKYLVPYETFVQKLYRLLLYKPYLMSNRELLFKELLVFALSNNGLSAELNGVPKEQLVQLVTNTETVVPLDAKVLTSTSVLSEQLKVQKELNSMSVGPGLELDGSSLSGLLGSLGGQSSNFGSSGSMGMLAALSGQNSGGLDSASVALLLAMLSKNSGSLVSGGNFDSAGPNIWSSFMNQNSGQEQAMGSGMASFDSSLGSGQGSSFDSSLGSNLGMGLGTRGAGPDASAFGPSLATGFSPGLVSGLGSNYASGLGSVSGLGSSFGSASGNSTK